MEIYFRNFWAAKSAKEHKVAIFSLYWMRKNYGIYQYMALLGASRYNIYSTAPVQKKY
jgi:hypothetical protein